MTNPDQSEAQGVHDAIYGVFGGVRAASRALQITTQAIYLHLSRTYIVDRDTALRWSDATALAGRRVPAAALMGLIPWSAPTAHPPKGRRSTNGHAADPERPALRAVDAPPVPREPSLRLVATTRAASTVRPGKMPLGTRCSGQLALADLPSTPRRRPVDALKKAA